MMSLCGIRPSLALLLAASSRTSGAEIMTLLGIAAGVIGAITGVIYWLNRAAHKRQVDSHLGLFQSLCQAHDLSRGDCSLLKQLVRQNDIEKPALVFVNPDYFEPARLGPLKAKAKEFLAIRNTLFVGPEKKTAKSSDKTGKSGKPSKPKA